MVFNCLSTAILAGAIPAQGQLALVKLLMKVMNLEYGLSLQDNALWKGARLAFLTSLSDGVDSMASDIECGKFPAAFLVELHEQLAAYSKQDFGSSSSKVD